MQAARLARSVDDVRRADAAEADICAVLRGELVQPSDPHAFVDLAVFEGVAPLLWQSPSRPPLPSTCIERLREDVRCQLALATVREPELRRVLAALVTAGVDALLIKGAHVAYAFYPEPSLRPRHDTDLLIRPGDEQKAHAVLEILGYRRQPAITGVAVQGQVIFDCEGVPGSVLDVHCRLASPVVAAELFDFSELWRRAQPIPALGSAARGPHPVDALAIAAVHLLAHHPNERGLLWLHDLRVIADALGLNGRTEFADRARRRKMMTVCETALRRSHGRFPSDGSADLVATLGRAEPEPSAALLDHRGPSAQALLDVRALRGWRVRTGYMAGHLFPPSDYMRRRYAPGSRAPLPWLYAARIIRGARKWIS